MEYKVIRFSYSTKVVDFLNRNKIEKENIIAICCESNGVFHLIYRG